MINQSWIEFRDAAIARDGYSHDWSIAKRRAWLVKTLRDYAAASDKPEKYQSQARAQEDLIVAEPKPKRKPTFRDKVETK